MGWGKKVRGLALLAIVSLLFGLIGRENSFVSYGAEKPSYLKSATYCSNDWVVNFWNSESSHMDEELERIAEDGFNSIILVVPWQEFQPEMLPVRYESYAFRKLDQVMEAASSHGLWVILRVGYTWDYSSGDGIGRYEKLLYEESTREAWLDYVREIYETAAAHDNFYGGFLTWEDFWNFVQACKKGERSEESIKKAELIGYQDYVREHCTLEELKEQFGLEAESYEKIWIPAGTEPSFALFYEFYDSFLNQLLKESQTVFPDLSMEVRLDVDPVPGTAGGLRGCAHEITYSCQDAPYTCAMYSVAMGQEMDREISAGEADRTMKHILAGVKAVNGGKGIYLDQFLYTDNTPGFEHNARLKQEEKRAFLEDIGPTLKDHTIGYGVWAYWNYGNNALYNAQFALGEAGWKFDKGCEVVERNGSKKAKLAVKNSITQEFGRRLGDGEIVKVSFTAEAEGMVQIEAAMGREIKYVTIQGEEEVYLEFLTRGESITFSADGEAFIDDVKVYTFETDGELYGMDGEERELADVIRSLNAGL